MATNPLDKVYLTQAQLDTLAGGGSITSGSDTYTADDSTLYMTPDTSEDVSNKVTSLSGSSTDTQYPSAKCVYDLVGDIESLLGGI